MKIAVEQNYLGGQILYIGPDPLIKMASIIVVPLKMLILHNLLLCGNN